MGVIKTKSSMEEKRKISVELPCNVGDTVYILQNGEVKPVVVSRFCIEKRMEIFIHIENEHVYYTGRDIGVMLFTSEKEATEAREKRKKNGKNSWL